MATDPNAKHDRKLKDDEHIDKHGNIISEQIGKNRYNKEFKMKVMHEYRIKEVNLKVLSEKYEIPYSTLRKWQGNAPIKKIDFEKALSQKYEKEFVKKGFDKKKIASIVGTFLEAQDEDSNIDFKVVKDGLDLFMKLTGVGKEEVTQDDKNVQIQIVVNTPEDVKKPIDIDFTEIDI